MNWQNTPDIWRRNYTQSGYLVVENVLDEAALRDLRVAFEQIETDFAADALPSQLKRFVVSDSERGQSLGQSSLQDSRQNRALSVVMELPLFAPNFRDLIVHPRVLDVLEALFESSEFAFHNLKAVCKMPHNQSPFQWHRDLPYLQHTTPDLLTCMLCLDAMTAENGATVVCPGSHRIAHEDVKASDANIAEDQVPHPRVTVECPAGSAVLFHVNIVHGGGPNQSVSKRRNLISIWSGPQSYPTTAERYAFEFVKPRSADPMRQRQIEKTFGTP